tara:strand:+ start:333 stop:659 length:327 start_codon:yes stop_codon:yes gene_type:complete
MSTPFKMTGFSGFGNSPMKQAKVKQFEAKDSEMETLKNTKAFPRHIAKKIAEESTVIPEIEIKAKKPEVRYTTADLNNANREQKGAIMFHARKNKYKIGGKTAKLTTQ